MYLADCGISTTTDGNLLESEFIKYRVHIEPRGKPLLPELLKLYGLGILPNVQILWTNIKRMIAEALAHRSQNNGMDSKKLIAIPHPGMPMLCSLVLWCVCIFTIDLFT